MASEGGGKLKQKRNQTSNKPYERKSSLFGKLKDSVKDLLIPSWLSGSPSVKQDEVQSGSTQRPSPHVDTPRPSGRIGSVAPDWSHGSTFQSDRLVHGPMTIPYGNSTSGKLNTNIPGPGLQTPNGELVTASHTVTPAPNLTIGSHVHPVSSGSKPISTLSSLESEDQRHSGLSEFQQIQEFEVTPVRPVMVSTGVHKSASAKPDVKRQRLWSPEPIRQGKPLVPPTRGKPSFNTLLFGTPSKGDTSTVASGFGDSSFYVGKTRFGGASSAKKALNTTLPYQSSLPLRKQVKVTRLNSSFNATTSSTAQRILDTLERMSTPLEDAKKIPHVDQGNDSVLSFTPSSYRRQSTQCSVRPITRPLQLPNRGPPTSHLQNATQFEIARNRDRSKPLRQESESALSITQETVSTKEDASSSTFTASMGKMKSKKFSQHISSRQEEEVTPVVHNLRTEFTLPAVGMAPIILSFGGAEKSSNKLQTAAVVSTKSDSVSPLKFTFSTPIEEKNRPSGSQLGGLSERGFQFSSPIHVSPNKTSAAGAEGGSKSSPEPAVGAATPQVSMWSSPQMVKPKAMSPDIGGTSSSFKSYTKWSGNQKNEASNGSPAFGIPGPATTLKKGSVMDILGGGKSNGKDTSPEEDTLRKKLNTNEPSRSHGVTSDNNGQSNAIPLSALFKKPIGSWECDACMVQNTSSDNKCIACTTPNPGSKPTGATQFASDVNKPLSALFKKPEGSWECGACLVQNNASASKCVACTTPKPGSKSGPSAQAQGNNTPLSSWFKKPDEGSWECDTCMIRNTASALKCVACETPKPGAKSAMPSNKSNNSLAGMFKKPEGSWECDTCMVQNSSTALRCIACDSSKPGLQSAGVVSKPSSSASSQIEIAPSGGFSFNMPSTTTTTTGSAGFKFGNTSASVISSDAAPLSSGGFSFGHNSSKDSLSVNNSETKSTPLSGGFQFGALSSSTSVSSPSGGLQFGTSVTSSADSGSKVGFTFDSSSKQVTLSTNQSLSTVSPSSTISFTSSNNADPSKSSTAAVTGGFQFGSDVPASSVTIPVDKKSEASAPSQPTFTFGATPAASTQASPFVFGAPVSSAPPSYVGLGMGQSLASSAPSVPPLVNGVFGASSNSGLNTGSSGFAFGAKQPSTESSSSQISNTTKRPIDSTGFKGPGAKISPVFGSVSKEPSVNGGFNFNGGTVGQSPFSSNPSTNSGAFVFGSNQPSQPPSTVGFQFASAPSNKPDPPAAVTGFSFTTNAQSGQDSQVAKKSEVSFTVAPNFNFTGTPAPDGNASSSVFQFGAKAPEAPAPSANLFAFGSSTPSLSQPTPPVFGASAGSSGLGTFSMGSADTSQRKMKKAVRRIKPR